MYTPATQANPFALLMDPDAVFRTVETSSRLKGLQSRICRPLDKPLIPRTADADIDDLDSADDDLERHDGMDRIS